jgi:ribosomal-protein-serine acetyltransferase
MSELHRPDPVTLDAPPLSLRPWHEDYATALHEAARESLQSVGRWLPWCHAGYDMDEALKWIAFSKHGWQKGEHYTFAVFDAQGTLIGDVGLNQIDGRNLRANLGYWLRPTATGRGYAAHAGRALTVFGFETLGLRRIEIVAAIDNLASQRTAEHIGAQREGIARQRIVLHGQSQDGVVYGLLPADLA